MTGFRPASARRGDAIGALLLLSLGACETPIGVAKVGFEPVFEARIKSILNSDALSDQSRQLLAALGLEAAYAEDPGAVIAQFDAAAMAERRRPVFALLAEMHYARAVANRSASEFLAAAILAHQYLLSDELRPEPNPFDPWFRLSCDIYNRALAQALLDHSGHARLVDGVFETSLGTVEVAATRPGFPWGPEEFSRFLPADAYHVRGLRERVRSSGLGVPLIAIRDEQAHAGAIEVGHIGRQVKMPATAVLEVEGGLAALQAGRIKTTLQLYLAGHAQTITLGGHQVPLETDMTAPLAYTLEDSTIWDFSIRGFMSADDQVKPGVYLIHPYQRGKIPLVLVHGTASNPATWAQMLNGLNFDWMIRSNYQIWLAIYNTGSPILFNAGEVRTALTRLVDDLDPDATDDAIDRMVVAGHSQGGLITRLLVSSSGDRIWRMISDEDFADYPLAESSRETLQQSIFFAPLPFIERVVFVATPHRGSFVANTIIGSIARRLVTLPEQIVKFSQSVRLRGDIAKAGADELPTSVENMREDSQFVRLVREFPFAPDVHLHSIIAVKGSGPPEQGDDGVVRFTSAHLPQAESEFVVRSGHSCQNEPQTIFELRRILLEHLRKPARPDRPNRRSAAAAAR